MSIISGAIAERMKLFAFLAFAIVSDFIYPIQGSWSWGGGFLSEAGFSDFAGSGIVHMCGAPQHWQVSLSWEHAKENTVLMAKKCDSWM